MTIVDSRIDLFIEFVNQNISKPTPTAESIAQEIHMSRSTLFRMVERELGMSPFQYIRKAKLERAKVLLEEGMCYSIKEMASAVGYSRTDYFALIFMDTFGIDLNAYFKR